MIQFLWGIKGETHECVENKSEERLRDRASRIGYSFVIISGICHPPWKYYSTLPHSLTLMPLAYNLIFASVQR